MGHFRWWLPLRGVWSDHGPWPESLLPPDCVEGKEAPAGNHANALVGLRETTNLQPLSA